MNWRIWTGVCMALIMGTLLIQSFFLFTKEEETNTKCPKTAYSRYNSYSYSNSFNTVPFKGMRSRVPTQFSTSFTKALDEYEKMQAEMIASPETSRWVVFTTEGVGLANRLQGISSCFLFALITKRAFAINWYAGYVDPQTNINDEGSKMMAPDTELFDPPINWSLANVPKKGMDTKRFLSGDMGSGHLNEFLCSDFETRFEDMVVDIHTWDYFAPFIAHNSRYKAQILKWFGGMDNIDGSILRYLLRLQPSLQIQVDTFVEQNFKPFTVGMHLRMTGNKNYHMEQDHENAAFQCAGVPFGDSVNPAGVLAFPGFDEHGEFHSLSAENVTIFLATDKEETAKAAKAKYGDRLIMLDSMPITRGNKEGIIRGVLDLFILAQCDDFVLSFQSSYGRAAAAMAGVAPLVISHEAKCMRDVTTEPCCCGWIDISKLYCYNATLHDTPFSVNQVGCSTCDGISRLRKQTLN